MAQPEPRLDSDGSYRYYATMVVPGGVTWNAARESAAARGGYPAAITSLEENEFVFGLTDADNCWHERPGYGLWSGLWLGGYQSPGSPSPDSGWRWISGERFDFRNWSPGEPGSAGVGANALHLGEAVRARAATWDATARLDDAVPGYVLELSADTTTVGLIQDDSGATDGYRLFAPMSSRNTYLIDREGRLVHQWHSDYRPGLSVHLLEDGMLLRTCAVNGGSMPGGGAGGRVEMRNWEDSVVWSYSYSDDSHCQHHDIERLPSGNILLVAWERKTRAEAIEAGRDTNLLPEGELWPDHLVEVDPSSDSIVWQWHLWDHLVQDYDSTKSNYGVVADHPELVNLNYCQQGDPGADWIHTNAVDYNPQLDQIVLSAHNFCEVWAIDHSTTAVEAGGHTGGRQGRGGDLLYRWGNPAAYGRGVPADRKLDGQHDVHWIEPGLPGAGHILLFNNGMVRGYSTVDEFAPPVDSVGVYQSPAPGEPFGPQNQCWVYGSTPPSCLFSRSISGAQRLRCGNTIVCEGEEGRFLEVRRDSQPVWIYVNPVVSSGFLPQGDSVQPGVNGVFRVILYMPDYPGLAGRDLTPGFPLERYSAPPLEVAEAPPSRISIGIDIAPNPSRATARVSYTLPSAGRACLRLYDAAGRLVLDLGSRQAEAGPHSATIDASRLCPGIYMLRLVTDSGVTTRKLTVE